MKAITLTGNNLGERHKHLNTLVNKAFSDTHSLHIYRTYEERSDVDRLFKIDLAIKCKDVNYIIETLQCDDMLYVCRALKATWLITDHEYAHIIHPEHLYTVLFPQMYSKAIGKLKYNILHHLKSEERCEEFYKYHLDQLEDPVGAFKFLPNCSKAFIQEIVNETSIFTNVIAIKCELAGNVFKRICERFVDLAEVILKRVPSVSNYLLTVLEFIRISETEIYLNLLETYLCDTRHYNFPALGRAMTRKIGTAYAVRFCTNLEVYLPRIHQYTMAKYVKTWPIETIEKLVKDISENKRFSKGCARSLLSALSIDEWTRILNKYYPVIEEVIDKTRDQYIYIERNGKPLICPINLHKWYVRLPFETSLKEIKQLIRATMEPEEREKLLVVLSNLAGENYTYIHQVLTYYNKSHMNEMVIHKRNFLYRLMVGKNVFRFNEECWKLVHNLLLSLEVYEDNDLEQTHYCYGTFYETIVYYYILNDMPVPAIVMEKYRKRGRTVMKFNDEERIKIFNWLLVEYERVCEISLKNNGMTEKCHSEINMYYELLRRWDKCVLDFPKLITFLTEYYLQNPECGISGYCKPIVCYHIVNRMKIPEIIMERYLQGGYSDYVQYITNENKAKVFDYLVKDFETRHKLLQDEGTNEMLLDLTKKFINYVRQSGKKLDDFTFLITLMKYIVIVDPGSLEYPDEKPVRRLLFKVSILMSQEEEVVINVLKHDPTVFEKYFQGFELLMLFQKNEYKKFFRTVSVFFQNDLVKIFQNSLKNQLKECEKKTDSETASYMAKSLSYLCRKTDYMDVIKEYQPKNHKVEWSAEDMNIINIRKGIAKSLHIVRPAVEMETIYEFAQGDYLQYALAPLLSRSTSSPNAKFIKDILPKLINSPVSVQKHGIRIAFRKLTVDEVTKGLCSVWTKTKNVSIRNTMFESASTLLCKQAKKQNIDMLWVLLKGFLTNLQEDEERTILLYSFSNRSSLPKTVKCDHLKICYQQLRRIQEKIKWASFRNNLLEEIGLKLEVNNVNVADGMDIEFVEAVLLENYHEMFDDQGLFEANFAASFLKLFTKYTMSCDATEQSRRYNIVAKPVYDHIITQWDKNTENGFRIFFNHSLNAFSKAFHFKVQRNTMPVFEKIFQQFEPLCTVEKHFEFYLKMILLIAFSEAINATDFALCTNECYKNIGQIFGKECVNILTELIDSFFPSIQLYFKTILLSFVRKVLHNSSNFEKGTFVTSLIERLVSDDSISGNLLGLYFIENLPFNLEDFRMSSEYYDTVVNRIKVSENREVLFNFNLSIIDRN